MNPCPVMESLEVGQLVRLVNLQRAELNHHLGRIEELTESNGRAGVRLHNAIWKDQESKEESPMLAVKPENLRRVSLPTDAPLPVLDSIGRRSISRLLGDTGWGLPDNVVAGIASWLQICRVHLSDVTVTGCSSSRGDFPISAVLNDQENEWWISNSGTCPDGHGHEYLEFSFGAERRVTVVAVKIPALPYGPLSVRDFHLEVIEPMKSLTPKQLMTLDSRELQEFVLFPPLECRKLRLVCTRNAAAAMMSAEHVPRSLLGRGGDCIGLFQVGFA